MNHSLMTRQQHAEVAGLGHWQTWLYGWILLLIVSPLLLLGHNGSTVPTFERYIDIHTHTVVELFCGITALLIAALIQALSRQHQEGALKLFSIAFLVMGVLDVLHAATPPAEYPGLFVATHTLSMLFGGALLCLGTIRYYRAHRLPIPALQLSGELAVMLLLLVIIAFAYYLVLPPGQSDDMYGFSALARRAHEFAGALYAVAALLAFLYYRATRLRLVLVIAGILMLFGESAYLFRFSHLWDSTWWTWHAVKTGLYLGTLVAIAAALVVALQAVDRSRTMQVSTNRKLRHAHDELSLLNYELQIRNAMVNASINARTLDQTLIVIETALAEFLGSCRYTLMLRVPEDEIAEMQRGMQRQALRWKVQVSHESMPCVRLSRAVGGTGDELLQTCTPPYEAHTCMCLTLRAHDQVFGYLQIHVEHVELARVKREQLEVVSAEIGPIVHNALLHYRWSEAVAFRTALSRIAAILGSTLELPRVLDSVCQESAQLLGSDGSMILLADKPGARLQLASRCLLDAAAIDRDYGQPTWMDSDEGRALFRRLRASGRPLALVKPDAPGLAPNFPLGTNGCVWGALSMFPMLEGDELMAVMLIMRRERVPFSIATLEQGMLLAEQVRVAIANAHAYAAVRHTNEQLRHSEEERVRAERLALMGQMAASVAHEVRNPLSAINNCLAVLRRSLPSQNDAAAPALEIIDDEVRRLDRLTRNFMSLGCTPQRALARVHLDILVAHVCEGIERHMRHEGLDISVEQKIRGDCGAVMFNADGFQELLWNLLLNATQAIKGQGHVRVRLAQRLGYVFVAVADSGPGISPADRERIFEPFFSQRSQGAGLGLAIVLQHVKCWGGKLRVLGQPGACFALRFPVSTALTQAETEMKT